MTLRVIGAGFGRTGTLSLKIALEQLGFGKCYHMVELLKNRSGITHWERALCQQPVNWNQLFEGYQSAVDFPACYHIEELTRHYPEAKVILTTRDPDSWYASARQTILKARPTLLQIIATLAKYPFSKNARHMTRIGIHNNTLLSKRLTDEQEAKRIYREHNDRVRQLVPEKNLLVYQVHQGWEPLCSFLGCSIPPEAFPHTNRRAQFTSLVKPLLW